jgi:hypothetical protein
MWEVGGSVTLGFQVKDDTGTLVNPSTKVVTITLPDGTPSTPSISTVSTGVFKFTYTTIQAGLHQWRAVTTTPDTAYTDVFNVQAAAPPLIISLDEARDYLNIPTGETVNDEELRDFIEAATTVIERHTGPIARRTITTIMYPGMTSVSRPVIMLTSASLIRTGAAVDITSFVEEYGQIRSKSFAYLPTEPWALTYVVGRAVVPANVRIAARQVVKDLWTSQRGAGGRRAGQGELVRIAYVISYQALEGLEPSMQLTSGFA